jgi:polyhydroxybutyrate depolymerase
MNTRISSIRKLVILLILIMLPACQFGPRQNQEQSVSPAPETAVTSPAVPSPSVLVPTSSDRAAVPLRFVTGRNDYVTNVDDTNREFIVYVPGGYDPSRPTPVVIMFHGSNQSGDVMYENTNWAARAEQENFIVVFPTSWKYFLTSTNRVEDKWYEHVMEVTEPTVKFKDDVHFIKVIIDQLKATFNLDEKRIFASGFSNGASFVNTRLLVQMNDVFAAFAIAGIGPSPAGGGVVDKITDTVNTSLYVMFGTLDAMNADSLGLSLPFPFEAEAIVNSPNFNDVFIRTTTQLGLDMSFTVQSDPNFTKLTFDHSLVGADNELIFQMIRGMSHVYPDGDNNRARLDAADVFWEFFMRHSKP